MMKNTFLTSMFALELSVENRSVIYSYTNYRTHHKEQQ